MSETTRTYKPCPFCESVPYVNRYDIVNCTNDECIMSIINVELEEWNTRPDAYIVKHTPKECECNWEVEGSSAHKFTGEGLTIFNHDCMLALGLCPVCRGDYRGGKIVEAST